MNKSLNNFAMKMISNHYDLNRTGRVEWSHRIEDDGTVYIVLEFVEETDPDMMYDEIKLSKQEAREFHKHSIE